MAGCTHKGCLLLCWLPRSYPSPGSTTSLLTLSPCSRIIKGSTSFCNFQARYHHRSPCQGMGKTVQALRVLMERWGQGTLFPNCTLHQNPSSSTLLGLLWQQGEMGSNGDGFFQIDPLWKHFEEKTDPKSLKVLLGT